MLTELQRTVAEGALGLRVRLCIRKCPTTGVEVAQFVRSDYEHPEPVFQVPLADLEQMDDFFRSAVEIEAERKNDNGAQQT